MMQNQFRPANTGADGPGAGRKKGVPNKLTANIKATIMAAFADAGGKDYLVTVAKTDPRTFCMLLGKMLPNQVAGEFGPARQGSVLVWAWTNAALSSLQILFSRAYSRRMRINDASIFMRRARPPNHGIVRLRTPIHCSVNGAPVLRAIGATSYCNRQMVAAQRHRDGDLLAR
jgi:hypothetical protein